MSIDNKELVSKSKEILKELGYEVKTSHLYEFFSRLSGFKDHNTAKAKKTIFAHKIFDFEFSPRELTNARPLATQEILPGNALYLGNNENGEPIIVDSSIHSHLLIAGAMGSGKSNAGKIIATTKLLMNGDNSFVFIADSMRSAYDFNFLFKYNTHVCPVIYSQDRVRKLIDLLVLETQSRLMLLKKESCANLDEYEKKTGKKITKILAVFEEFHFLNSLFLENQEVLNQFKLLLRTGRVAGLTIIALAQRAMAESIPPEFIPSFINKIVFKVPKSEALYLIGNDKPGLLATKERGKGFSEERIHHFPFKTEALLQEALDECLKPIESAFVEIKPLDLERLKE